MGRAVFNYGSEKPVGALQGALPFKPFTSKHGIIVRILCFVGCSWISDFGLSLPFSFFLTPTPFLHKSASKRHYRTSSTILKSVEFPCICFPLFQKKKVCQIVELLPLILSFSICNCFTKSSFEPSNSKSDKFYG